MKKFSFLLLLALFLAAVLFSCQTPESNVQATKAVATSPADIEEISKIFYQLENTWNDRDVAGYKALWAPYSEVITKRGQVFKSDPKKEDPDMINRMKAERRKYKPDTNRIKVNGDKASAIVYLDSPEGKLIMDYKLEKMDGKWLIKQQRAQ